MVEDCCTFFEEPFFLSNAGACFTGRFSLSTLRATASRAFSLKVWLNVDHAKVLSKHLYSKKDNDYCCLIKLRMLTGGVDVMDRFSPAYVLSGAGVSDDPRALLYTKPMRASPSTVSTVALTNVLEDRSELKDDDWLLSDSRASCGDGPVGFEEEFDMPYTQDNCKMVTSIFNFLPNCSISNLTSVIEGTIRSRKPSY